MASSAARPDARPPDRRGAAEEPAPLERPEAIGQPALGHSSPSSCGLRRGSAGRSSAGGGSGAGSGPGAEHRVSGPRLSDRRDGFADSAVVRPSARRGPSAGCGRRVSAPSGRSAGGPAAASGERLRRSGLGRRRRALAAAASLRCRWPPRLSLPEPLSASPSAATSAASGPPVAVTRRELGPAWRRRVRRAGAATAAPAAADVIGASSAGAPRAGRGAASPWTAQRARGAARRAPRAAAPQQRPGRERGEHHQRRAGHDPGTRARCCPIAAPPSASTATIANFDRISATSSSTARIAHTRRAGHTIAANDERQHQHDHVDGRLADQQLHPQRDGRAGDEQPDEEGEERRARARDPLDADGEPA